MYLRFSQILCILTSVAGAVLGDVIGLARIVCVNKNGSECHCGYFNASKHSIYES